MKSLAERQAQRNEQRDKAGLDPIDFGAQTGARSAIAPARTKKGAKDTGEDTVSAAGNGGAGDPNWKPNT